VEWRGFGIVGKEGENTFELIQPFVVMEFVKGCSLQTALERKSLTAVARLRVVGQIVETMARLHEGSPPLLHCDLHTGEITLTLLLRLFVDLDFSPQGTCW